MVEPVPLTDFRALRRILEPEDFALYAGGPNPPQEYLVDQGIWDHMMILPEDVSIVTSEWHGRQIDSMVQLYMLWMDRVAASGKRSHPMLYDVILVCYEEWQASVFATVHGFYRVGMTCLELLSNVVYDIVRRPSLQA
jgi:hypothetical protein